MYGLFLPKYVTVEKNSFFASFGNDIQLSRYYLSKVMRENEHGQKMAVRVFIFAVENKKKLLWMIRKNF